MREGGTGVRSSESSVRNHAVDVAWALQHHSGARPRSQSTRRETVLLGLSVLREAAQTVDNLQPARRAQSTRHTWPAWTRYSFMRAKSGEARPFPCRARAYQQLFSARASAASVY